MKLVVAALICTIITSAWFFGGIIAWPHEPTVPLWFSIPLAVGIIISLTLDVISMAHLAEVDK